MDGRGYRAADEDRAGRADKEKCMKMDDVRRVVCQRCGLDMRVMVQTPNPEVTLMRFSDSGEGLCASCAATLFLYSVEHIKRLIEASLRCSCGLLCKISSPRLWRPARLT